MSDALTSSKVERAGTNINTWLQIGSALLLCGVIYGTMKTNTDNLAAQFRDGQAETKHSLADISTQIETVKADGVRAQFSIEGQQKEIGRLEGAITANTVDDNRQWESIRSTQSKVDAAMSREAFIEWKAQLERRNSTLQSPPLEPK